MALVLTPGQRHEMPVLEALLDEGAVKRLGCGRPKLRPETLLADRGYSSGAAYQACRKRGIKLETPPKKDHKRKRLHDTVLYRHRNLIERSVNRLKRHLRIATRYEKPTCFFSGMLTIAFILEWL